MKNLRTALAVLFLAVLFCLLSMNAFAANCTHNDYDENGICRICGDIRERTCDTVYCEKGRLTVFGKVPENIMPYIEPVFVNKDNAAAWSGRKDVSDLCYRMYEITLADSFGTVYESPNAMLTKINSEFRYKVHDVHLYRVYDKTFYDEYGRPYVKTVGEELKGAEWDSERITFSYTMPEKWLIVGTPDAWGLLAMRLNRLTAYEAGKDQSGEQLNQLLLSVDEAAAVLRANGVGDAELFNHEGIDWTVYNGLRSSALRELELKSGNVSVSGTMPGNSWLEVTQVPLEEVADYVQPEEVLLFAYDIKIKYGPGFEFQPLEDSPLEVVIRDVDVSSEDEVQITHIDEKEEASVVECSVADNGSLSFDAESFSIYLGTLLPKESEPVIAIDVGSWPAETTFCGTQRAVIVTVTNLEGAEAFDVKVSVDSPDFEIRVLNEAEVSASGNTLPLKCELRNVNLTEGNRSCRFIVDYSYKIGTEVKPGQATKQVDSLKIIHNNLGGWCLYPACDAYDPYYNGMFTQGDQRTYFRNNSPKLETNLQYNAVDARNHSFALVIDGLIMDPSLYTVYQLEGKDYAGVELKNDLIISLRTGKHTIRLTERDPFGNMHYALSWFRISSAVNTGDEDLKRITVLFVCGLTGAALSVLEFRKRKHHS